MTRDLLGLTNAYLAIEGLRESRLLSENTRQKLKDALTVLNHESEEIVKEHEEQDQVEDHSSCAAD